MPRRGAGASRWGLGERAKRDAQKGALSEMWVFGSAPFLTAMIEVDDSQLEDDYREFLQRWADALEVPVGELVLRIVEAIIDGDQYIKMRPRDD